MKAIMKTLKPKTCANIMNLIQSILVTKNKREVAAIQKLINEKGYAEIYVYCTMAKHIKDYLHIENEKYVLGVPKDYGLKGKDINGKVLFKFRCYKVEQIKAINNQFNFSLSDACISREELLKYINDTVYENDITFGWDWVDLYDSYIIHISDLKTFSRPKDVGEFSRYHDKKDGHSPCFTCKRFGTGCTSCSLTEAPKGWCYVG